MGVDISGYVGPFALCKNPYVPQERTMRSCTNEQCQQYKRERWDKEAKFCEKCGSPIDEITIVAERPTVCWGDLIEEIEERLCPASMEYPFEAFKEIGNVDVWINNRRDVSVGRAFDPKHECFALIPEPGETDKAIQAFEAECAESLTKIRDAYGPENVEIKWGVLTWLS